MADADHSMKTLPSRCWSERTEQDDNPAVLMSFREIPAVGKWKHHSPAQYSRRSLMGGVANAERYLEVATIRELLWRRESISFELF